MVDATTIRQLSRAVAGFSGASTTAFPQDVTISSAAGSLYLSIDHTLTATGSDIPQVGAVLLTLN
jgi:hypothetical protein